MFAADYVDTKKEKSSTSDLTMAQWELIKPLIPIATTGRPIQLPLKDVIDGILYHVKNGGVWEDLPHDFPDYRRVHEWLQRLESDGTWDKILEMLRRKIRTEAGANPDPKIAIIDSQTIKAAGTGGERGYDGGKRINGRKRHLLVDSMGLLIAVSVTIGSVSEARGAIEWLDKTVFSTNYPRLEYLLADQGDDRDRLKDYLEHECKRPLQLMVKKKAENQEGFHPQPIRWKVERTIGWLAKYRGLSKDDERSTRSSESLIKIAMIHLRLRRKPGPTPAPAQPTAMPAAA
jgi:putative transposase